jgi:hypothetical protein
MKQEDWVRLGLVVITALAFMTISFVVYTIFDSVAHLQAIERQHILGGIDE